MKPLDFFIEVLQPKFWPMKKKVVDPVLMLDYKSDIRPFNREELFYSIFLQFSPRLCPALLPFSDIRPRVATPQNTTYR